MVQRSAFYYVMHEYYADMYICCLSVVRSKLCVDVVRWRSGNFFLRATLYTCSSSVSNPVCLCAVCMTSMHVPLFVSQAAVVGKGERRGRGETLGVRGVRGWERRERGQEGRRNFLLVSLQSLP